MKWYGSYIAYKLETDIDAQNLLGKLKSDAFKGCAPSALSASGWVGVLEEDRDEVEVVGDCLFIKLRIDKKSIPSSLINAELKKEIKSRESSSGKKLKSDEKLGIKEGLIAKFASKVLPSPSYIDAFINKKTKRIFVGTSSHQNAELLLNKLRESCGVLGVELIGPDYDISDKLTDVLINIDNYDEFSVGDECSLMNISDGSTVTAKKEDISSDNIIAHISEGKSVNSIKLIWQHRVAFKVDGKFKISNIKPMDFVIKDIKDDLGESDSMYEEFRASMTVMTGDFEEILDDLMNI